MPDFKKNDNVTWRSSGTWKKGKVVHVLPPKIAKESALKAFHLRPVLYDRTAISDGMPRDHQSYLVAVPQEGGKKPKLYWPVVSQLKPYKGMVKV